MTDLEALYAGICAAPDEDTPRLALADFLDEEGGQENQFRADFVRTHCRLAREEPWSKPWRELNTRWWALYAEAMRLEANGELPWVAHLKGRVRAWSFERGLVGHLTLYSKRFVSEGEWYFAKDPVRSVKFVKLNSTVGSVKLDVLLACPHLARIAKLDLEGSGLKDVDLVRLGASPHLKGLRAIGLGGEQAFTKTAVPKLLKALPAVSELSFYTNVGFGDGYAAELARCKEFARIQVLDLIGASVTAAGVAAIVASPHAAGLTALRLVPRVSFDAANRADGLRLAEAIAGATLGKLQELNLNGHNIGDDGLKLLAGAAKSLPALRRLSLNDCGLTLPGVVALADSELGKRLLYIDLAYNANLIRGAKKLPPLFPDARVETTSTHV